MDYLDNTVTWVTTPSEAQRLQEAIQRVRELHKPTDCDCPVHSTDEIWCKNCYQDFPCLTIKALDGEQV
jgi:hypothetical protein